MRYGSLRLNERGWTPLAYSIISSSYAFILRVLLAEIRLGACSSVAVASLRRARRTPGPALSGSGFSGRRGSVPLEPRRPFHRQTALQLLEAKLGLIAAMPSCP